MLVVDEVEGDLVAVASQEPPRPQRVALPRLEHVAPHDPHDTLPQLVGVPEPEERGRRELCADLVVTVLGEAGLGVVVEPAVAPAPRGVRLAEVVEERRKPHRERVALIRCGLNDHERVLVDGEVVVPALLVETDRRPELREQLDENARVAGES